MSRPELVGGVMRDFQFKLLSTNVGAHVHDGTVALGGTRGPMAGARASVETSGEVEKRITATRVALTGLFALAWRKRKDHRSVWLTVDGQGFQAVRELDAKLERQARQWAAAFNSRAGGAAR